MDRCDDRQQVGNQDLMTETSSSQLALHVPGKGWQRQCWFGWDRSATATQKEKAFDFVVRTERPLLTSVSKQGKTKKETEIWRHAPSWPWHGKITLVLVPIPQPQSLWEALRLCGCAGSAVPATAFTLCFPKSSKSVFFTLDHFSPLLMFLVRMRKQRWSWMRERRLLSKGLFHCNKDLFSSSFN